MEHAIRKIYNFDFVKYASDIFQKKLDEEIDDFITDTFDFLDDNDSELQSYIRENITTDSNKVDYEEFKDLKYDFIEIKYKSEIDEIIESQVIDTFNNSICMHKNELKKKGSTYLNDNRRLIKQKLKDIEIFYGIDKNQKEFCGLSLLYNFLKKIEKNRNCIAHGNELKYPSDGNEMYYILSYIISIIIKKDLDKETWNTFISL